MRLNLKLPLILVLVLVLVLVLQACASPVASDSGPKIQALPSWNEGASKQNIMDFVAAVTDASDGRFVPEAERIAVFDNDGNLWSEQPMYFQLAFALDRLRALAPDHPEWQQEQPFKAALEGDLEAVMAGGERALLQLLMTTHAGMSTEEFDQVVTDWVNTARHPTSGKLYTEMVYQPMLELLDYLRANGFKTYIVSGGGIDFMRAWTERVYGIPPEQVVGSSIKTRFAFRDGVPEVIRLPEIDFIDDKEGKPVGIQRHIGRRPIAAFGNSDGDLQMLQWTAAGPGARLAVIVHHTDAAREWAYDRDSHVGRLDKALLEAKQNNWTIVDMKNDWNTIFSWQEASP